MFKRATKTAISIVGALSAGAVLLAAFQNCAPSLPSDEIDYASRNAGLGKRPSPTPGGPGISPPPVSTVPPVSVTWEGICTDNSNQDLMAIPGSDRAATYLLGFTKADGSAALWSFNPNQGVYRGQVCKMISSGWTLSAIGDFNADFNSDVIWRNADGSVVVWLMYGAERFDGGFLSSSYDSTWKIEAAVDVTGDRKADLIWRKSNGTVVVWQMNGKAAPTAVTLDTTIEAKYALVGHGMIADLQLPFKQDLMWRSTTGGQLRIWNINGSTVTDTLLPLGDGTPPIAAPSPAPNQTPAPTPSPINNDWNVRALADFDGDSVVDIMWQNKSTRALRVWKMGIDPARRVIAEYEVATPTDGWVLHYPILPPDSLKADLVWVIPTQNGFLPGIMGMSLVPNLSLKTLNPIRADWSLFKYDRHRYQSE